MNIVLVTTTPMVKQLFTIISKKLNLELITNENLVGLENVQGIDILVLDHDFIDESFSVLQKNVKKIGVISKEDLAFDKKRDFLLNRPFLPSDLQIILENQIADIKLEKLAKQQQEIAPSTPIIEEPIIIEKTQEEKDKEEIENIAQDVAIKIDEDVSEDISLVKSEPLLDNSSSILNIGEISEIQDILNDGREDDKTKDEEWMDLSDIISNVISEVYNEDQPQETEPIKLILNDFTMKELLPLFRKLDKSILDTLTDGNIINLKLQLRRPKNEK